MHAMLASVAMVLAFLAQPPEGGPPRDRPPGPPEFRGEGPRDGRGPREGRGPRGGDRQRDRDWDDVGDRGPRMRLTREGDRWILRGVDIIWPAVEGSDEPPIEVSAESMKLVLEGGREIEIRPGPMPPPPPGRPGEGRGGPGFGPSGPPNGDRPFDGPPRGDRPFDEGPGPGPAFRPTDGPPRPPHPPGPPILGEDMRPSPPDAEVMKLEEQQRDVVATIENVARSARQASPSENKEQVRERLTDLVAKQFDIRQEIRRRMLGRIEGDVGRIRESIEKREQSKAQMIERRVSEILGEGVIDF